MGQERALLIDCDVWFALKLICKPEHCAGRVMTPINLHIIVR